jgi:ketosteroid isomerase-like protein
MSANLERLKRLYGAFAKGDVAAVLGAMDDRIEWREPESLPYEDQVGPQAVAENIFARVLQDVNEFSVTPQEFIDGDEAIACTGTYSGRGARTGLSFNTPFVHVWKFRNGKIVYFRTYTDTKVWADVLGTGAAVSA